MCELEKIPFFTHIPKTAGTAVRKQLLYPNIPPRKRGESNGFRELLRKDWSGCRWLEGHFPYGIHRYMWGLDGTPVYFTMLRDPLEQATSYYYFIHACSTQPDSSYEHPLYEEVQRYDLTDFYARPEHQNMQTRFLAGCIWDRLRNFRASKILDQWLLETAKDHLMHQYACFGLVSRFDSSLRMFSDLFGWDVNVPERRIKSNQDRPTTDELSDTSRRTLEEYLHLDIKLYAFARRHFEHQEQLRDSVSQKN